MPRARDPNRDKAFEIWKQHNGEITNRAIAEQLGVLEKTISSWKSRDKWNAVLQKDKCSTAKKKPRYPNGHPGNKNPVNKFAERNQAARKHGLFSRYMPKETLAIMEEINDASPTDLMWMQIQIQFSAIIRAQEIMFVESKDEMIKELKKAKYEFHEIPKEQGGGVEKNITEEEYEFQFAWDRQATFLTAQTRALSELRGSIKQFIEMTDSDDERRLKLDIMQQQLTKLERGNASNNSTEDKLKDYFTALGGAFKNES